MKTVKELMSEKREEVLSMISDIVNNNKRIFQVEDLLQILSLLLNRNIVSLTFSCEPHETDNINKSAPYLVEYNKEDVEDLIVEGGGFIFAENANDLVKQTELDNTPKGAPRIYALCIEGGVITNENT